MASYGRFAFLITVLAAFISFNHNTFNKPEIASNSIDISDIVPVNDSEIRKIDLPKPIVVEAEDFLVKVDPNEYQCMRTNMYYEARNQRTDNAYIAVGYTVLNRVKASRYPNTICGVVQQARRTASGQVIRNKCQFSWFCDGKGDTPNLNNVLERRAWERAGELAAKVMREEVDNPVGSATMYHATYVSPYWRTAYQKVATIETHIFYTNKEVNNEA